MLEPITPDMAVLMLGLIPFFVAALYIIQGED